MRKILFAVPDRSDLFVSGDEHCECSVLRLLRERSFDNVVLLGLPEFRLSTALTERAIADRFPGKTVWSHAVEAPSLSYKAVFNGLKKALKAETSELQTDDRLTFLLPSVAEESIRDCCLLSVRSLLQKVEVCQSASTTDAWVQQTFQTEEDAFEWHDSATDKDKNATFLLTKQLDFLYRAWNRNAAFCLKTRDTKQQKAISLAMRLYGQTSEQPYREIACTDIPEDVSNELLWGYRAEVNGKTVVRDGLLTKGNEGVAFLQWDAFPEDLKSNTVAFLSKSGRRLMALSNTEDEFSQIPTYTLPN